MKFNIRFSFSIFIFVAFFLNASILWAKEQQVRASLSPKEPFTNKTLTIAINKTSFPYHFIDAQGEVAGLMPELWRLWAEKQQVSIEFVTLPWHETLKQVAEGKVDIHAGLSILDNRKNSLAFSRPLFPLYTRVYVNSNLTNITDMGDLTPYAIGVIKGSAHIDMLMKEHPELKQKIFSNRLDLYQAAINKEILVFMAGDKVNYNYQYYQQLNAMYPDFKRLRYRQGDYGVAVAKTNKDLLTFIELGLTKLSPTERADIERKWLGVDKTKGSIFIAYPPNYPPYSAQSITRQPRGLMIDMWRLWAKETNTKVTFIPRKIEESLSLVNNNEIDILVAFPKALLDQNRFSLANPIYESKAKVFISKKIPYIKSLSYFDQEKINYKVAISQETLIKPQLLAKYPHIKFQYFETTEELLKAAELGEVDVFFAEANFMELKLLKENLQSLFYTLETPTLNLTFSPLIKKGNTRLLNTINEGFERIKTSQLINLEERWLKGNNHYYQNLLKKVTLTKQEEQLIEQDKAISIGFLKTLGPTEFVNEENEFTGINRDILNLISERTGLNFKFIGYDSWNQLYGSMLAGDIDMLSNITPTKSRREKFLFTQSYWTSPWVVIHPQYIGKQLTLSNFYDKRLAIIKESYLVDFIKDNHPQIALELVKDKQQGLSSVQLGKTEGFIEAIFPALQLLKQESLLSLSISALEEVPLDYSHFGVQKSHPLLVSILDKALASISAQEKGDIRKKWVSYDINTGLDKNVVIRVALQVTLLIAIVLIIIIMWNKRLRSEVNQRKQLEEKMKYMANHDDLTGLANRVLLKDRINTAIEFHQRQSLQMAVLFLDLDGFKIVNDTYGHDVGDELLVLVAERLQSCVRTSDTVVRFGGDEFVLLLTGLHHSNEVSFVADKVLQKLQSPFELSSTTEQIGCSIGISMYPRDGKNDTELLKVADTLMYQVKSLGKNHYLASSQLNENNHSPLG